MTDDLRSELSDSLEGRFDVLDELSGGGMARVFLAEESRLGRKVVIKVLPTELSAGVLMVDGRHDAIFPYEASQLPMFRLLGSGPDRKRHVVVDDAAHCPPRTLFIREALNWYDRFMDPVER